MSPVFSNRRIVSAVFSAIITLAGASAFSPVQAQEGVLMRNILGNLGILPEDKDAIEYRERAPLVVPKDMKVLRRPEDPEAHTKTSQWPVDPDVEERKREKARRQTPSIFATRSTNPNDGNPLTQKEILRGRLAPGTDTGEPQAKSNDQSTIKLTPQEMDRFGKLSSANLNPSYPPGTEPPRKYLTDPPKGLRIPSANAPLKRTSEGPDKTFIDDWKPDAHKRLE